MLLCATDLVVRLHPSLPATLDRVSFTLAAGELVAVVGSNGSGKSTLARALAGIVELESGQVEGPSGSSSRVGLVLQDPAAQLIAVTVADEVALGPEGAGHAPTAVARSVHAHLALQDIVQLAPVDPAALSGGQQQRVAIAAIAACEVDVLVLDEPTALLDPQARREFATNIRTAARGRGVAWITQEPEDVASCDRVVVLEAGTVAWEGAVADYVTQSHVAGSFELELPAAARVAHALGGEGAWPRDVPIPLTIDALVAALDADA